MTSFRKSQVKLWQLWQSISRDSSSLIAIIKLDTCMPYVEDPALFSSVEKVEQGPNRHPVCLGKYGGV